MSANNEHNQDESVSAGREYVDINVDVDCRPTTELAGIRFNRPIHVSEALARFVEFTNGGE
jgi:hypothetical protein